MNKYVTVFLYPLKPFKMVIEWFLKKYYPEKLFSLRYYRAVGKFLNLHSPKTLYDKIAYMAFRTDTSKWIDLADKVEVRKYVESCNLSNILTKLYGVYKNSSEIDYDELPNQFVLKTNNACATNIIVNDKSQIDIQDVNSKLDKWLKIKYGYNTCQPHYSKIKPLILAEEFLIDNETTLKNKMLIDYKFYCFNGKPYYVMVMSGRKLNHHKVNVVVFDMDWNSYPQYISKFDKIGDPNMKCPVSFDRMKEYASVLSKGFPFVRVDFYEINGEPIFGEMSFTPGTDAGSYIFHKDTGKICSITDLI